MIGFSVFHPPQLDLIPPITAREPSLSSSFFRRTANRQRLTPFLSTSSAHFAQTRPTENAASLLFSISCAHLQKQWRGGGYSPRPTLPYSFPQAPSNPRIPTCPMPATMNPCPTGFPGSPKTPLRAACLNSRKEWPLRLQRFSSPANPAPAKTISRASFTNSVRAATLLFLKSTAPRFHPILSK